MKILVVDGAGYIGSHMVKLLIDRQHIPITFDSLIGGYRDAVLGGQVVVGDLADKNALRQVFRDHAFDAVMHFASFIQVGESVHNPSKYYGNNLVNTVNLLDAMVEAEVKTFVFSSTAAVFGEPQYSPIDEKHSIAPINPYGASKAMVERILEDYDSAYGLKSVCLRYFNAAGADPSGKLGERHEPETHLIPLVLQAASGRRESISIFGRDYDTPDGSCIRDYIHVSDLCEAHMLAMDYLKRERGSARFNLGNGNGFSVLDVIRTAESVTQRPIRIMDGPRRMGDAARLVADSRLSQVQLGWKPKYAQLDQIVAHAWAWEKTSHCE